MAYILPVEMLQYGADRLAQLAWPDRSGQADGALLLALIIGDSTEDWTPEQIAAGQTAVAKIEQEIQNAAVIIDASLSMTHTLPLSGKLDLLGIWNGDIAFYRLHQVELPETDPVLMRYRDAYKGLVKVEQGQLHFGATQTSGSSNVIVFASKPPIFGREK